MTTKELNVFVSFSGDNYNGGVGDPELGAIFVTAQTFDEFRKEFKDSLEFHIEGLKERGKSVSEYILSKNFDIRYQYHNL